MLKPCHLFKTGINGANEVDFLSFLIEAVILRGKGVGVIKLKSRRQGVPYHRGLDVACYLCGGGPSPSPRAWQGGPGAPS